MNYDPWHIWALISIILLIGEIFAPGMILGCLAIGAVGGLAGDLLGLGLQGQTLIASFTSILAFIFIRPFVLKYLLKSSDVKTGIEALIGRNAKVTVDFDTESGYGRCQIDGDDWKAISDTKDIIKRGDMVEITNVNSAILTIKSSLNKTYN